MISMDIVILANFCGDLSAQDNGRFSYLARSLVKSHQVELITSDFHHDSKSHRTGPPDGAPFKVTLLHEPGYPKNICLRRFVSHRDFGRNVSAYLAKRRRPDVVYCAVPSLTAALAAADYCRENGVRSIVDIQDLWPEAFEMVFHIPVLSGLLFAPFRSMADQIYSAADAICAVSHTYVDRALKVNKKVEAGSCVYLGTRLEDFDQNARANAVTDKPEKELWLGYCGTLGASYDLTCTIDALALLDRQGRVTPRFIVMGDGPRREEFETYAQRKGVAAEFMGRLPYPKMCGVLSACDIVVNPIVGSSAASIINKHADYAACGRAVLNTQSSPEYRELVDMYRMGFNCVSGDAGDLAGKLSRLLEDPALRAKMGRNARRCAEEKFDRAKTYQALVEAIEGTICKE